MYNLCISTRKNKEVIPTGYLCKDSKIILIPLGLRDGLGADVGEELGASAPEGPSWHKKKY